MKCITLVIYLSVEYKSKTKLTTGARRTAGLSTKYWRK